eukprot:2603993-Pleurochrysis_carterae.AAC.1
MSLQFRLMRYREESRRSQIPSMIIRAKVQTYTIRAPRSALLCVSRCYTGNGLPLVCLLPPPTRLYTNYILRHQ